VPFPAPWKREVESIPRATAGSKTVMILRSLVSSGAIWAALFPAVFELSYFSSYSFLSCVHELLINSEKMSTSPHLREMNRDYCAPGFR